MTNTISTLRTDTLAELGTGKNIPVSNSFTTGIVGSYAYNRHSTASFIGDSAANYFPNATNFSVSCWFNLNTLTPVTIVWSISSGSIIHMGVTVDFTTSKLIARIYNAEGGHSDIGLVTVGTGEDHHAVVTYDGKTYNFYLDNVLVGSVDTTFLGFGADKFQIGAKGGTNYGDLVCDEVLMYSKTLTVSEIDTLYNKNSVTNSLVAKYSFEEGSGTLAHDTAFTSRSSYSWLNGLTITSVLGLTVLPISNSQVKLLLLNT